MSTTTTDAPDRSATHTRATVHPDKAAAVAEITESFRGSSAAVLTEYRGLTVKQISALRVALGADTSYAVVKNTLTRIAARKAGLEAVEELLSGPTAVAFISGEPVAAAKALREFARANPALVVKGGVMDGRTLTSEEVGKLADLESREVLLAKMAGALLASLSNAVYLLNAPLAQAARVVGALQAKAEQDPSVLGGGAGQAPVAAPSNDEAPVEPAGPEAVTGDMPVEPAGSEAVSGDVPVEPAGSEAVSGDVPVEPAGPEAVTGDVPVEPAPEPAGAEVLDVSQEPDSAGEPAADDSATSPA